MSKAILVLDMPKNCFHCKLQDWVNCRITKGCHTGYTRPDWCPLREVPQKQEDLPTNIYREGWNACIDEIMKGVQNE